jgi:hypothetical protein
VEAKIFQQENLAWFQRCHSGLNLWTNTVAHKRDGPTQLPG